MQEDAMPRPLLCRLALLALIAPALTLAVGPPPPRRGFTATQAKQLTELNRQFNRDLLDGKFSDALDQLEHVRRLHVAALGPGHWKLAEAQAKKDHWGWLAKVKDDDRAAVAGLFRSMLQVRTRQGQEQHAAAVQLARAALP